MNSTADILRNMASQFASLAEAIEAEQADTNTKIAVLESEIYKNKNLLKNIANMINEEL